MKLKPLAQKKIFFLFILGLRAMGLQAQVPDSFPMQELEPILVKLCLGIRQTYVREELHDSLCLSLIRSYEQGAYSGLWPDELALRLERDLKAWSNDAHFSVFYFPSQAISLQKPRANMSAARHRRLSFRSFFNFSAMGMSSEGVAHLRLDAFESQSDAYEDLAYHQPLRRVFKRIEGAHSLILDLRYNEGGRVQAAYDLAAWLSEGKESRDFSQIKTCFYDSTLQYFETWKQTYPMKPQGRRKPKLAHLYILSSPQTFSAAEILIQYLKQEEKQGRGPKVHLVGEATAGGLHAFDDFLEINGFHFCIPDVAFFDAEGQSFDGVGFKPDYPCAADSAFVLAQRLAKAHAPNSQPLAPKLVFEEALPLLEVPDSLGQAVLAASLPLQGQFGRIEISAAQDKAYLTYDFDGKKRLLYCLKEGRYQDAEGLFFLEFESKACCLSHLEHSHRECYRSQ